MNFTHRRDLALDARVALYLGWVLQEHPSGRQALLLVGTSIRPWALVDPQSLVLDKLGDCPCLSLDPHEVSKRMAARGWYVHVIGTIGTFVPYRMTRYWADKRATGRGVPDPARSQGDEMHRTICSLVVLGVFLLAVPGQTEVPDPGPICQECQEWHCNPKGENCHCRPAVGWGCPPVKPLVPLNGHSVDALSPVLKAAFMSTEDPAANACIIQCKGWCVNDAAGYYLDCLARYYSQESCQSQTASWLGICKSGCDMENGCAPAF
jgi:hypothetical protein